MAWKVVYDLKYVFALLYSMFSYEHIEYKSLMHILA